MFWTNYVLKFYLFKYAVLSTVQLDSKVLFSKKNKTNTKQNKKTSNPVIGWDSPVLPEMVQSVDVLRGSGKRALSFSWLRIVPYTEQN